MDGRAKSRGNNCAKGETVLNKILKSNVLFTGFIVGLASVLVLCFLHFSEERKTQIDRDLTEILKILER